MLRHKPTQQRWPAKFSSSCLQLQNEAHAVLSKHGDSAQFLSSNESLQSHSNVDDCLRCEHLLCWLQLHDGFTDAYYYVRKATLACVKGHMEHFAQLRAAKLNSSRTATAADDSASKPVVSAAAAAAAGSCLHLNPLLARQAAAPPAHQHPKRPPLL